MAFLENLVDRCQIPPSGSNSLAPSPSRARAGSVVSIFSNSPARPRINSRLSVHPLEELEASVAETAHARRASRRNSRLSVHTLEGLEASFAEEDEVFDVSHSPAQSSDSESCDSSDQSDIPPYLAKSTSSQVAVLRRTAEKAFAKKLAKMSKHADIDLYGGSLTGDFLLRDIKHRRRATSKSFRHFRKMSEDIYNSKHSRPRKGNTFSIKRMCSKLSVDINFDDDPSDDEEDAKYPSYQEPQVLATHLARCERLGSLLHDQLVSFWQVQDSIGNSNNLRREEPLIDRWRRKASEIRQSYRESNCLNTEIEVMVMRDKIKDTVTVEWTNEEDEAQRRKELTSSFWRLYHIDDRKMRAPLNKRAPLSLSPATKEHSRVDEVMVQTKSNFWKKARNSDLPDARLVLDVGERLQNRLESETDDANDSKIPLGSGKMSTTRRLVQHRSCVHHRRGKEGPTLASSQSLPALPVTVEEFDEDDDDMDFHTSFVDRGGFLEPSSRRLQKQIIQKGLGANTPTLRIREQTRLSALKPQVSLPALSVVPARNQAHCKKESYFARTERLPPVVSFPAAFDKTPLHAPVKRNESTSESYQDETAESATMKYIRVCRAAGVVPTPFVLQMANTCRITNSSPTLVDDDLRAVASMVRALDRLEFVDLSSNTMLTDRAFETFLKKLFGRPATTSLKHLSLEGCKGAGKAALETMISLLKEDDGLHNLEYFNIGGIAVPAPSHLLLCKAIAAHPTLKSVSLASIGLGRHGFAKDCLKAVMTSQTLEELDLSWNCFDWDVFQAFGKDVVTHDKLTHLNLASCSTAAMQNGDVAIAWFLEALAHDRHLKMLDISLNCIDFKGALVLEDALANHKCLSEIIISQNPLGVGGMRSFLRLLSRESSGLRRFSCTSCMGQGGLGDDDTEMKERIFNATDPSGRYVLDLSRPYSRAVLRMLYRTCERFRIAPSNAFLEMEYSMNSSSPAAKTIQQAKNNSTRSGKPTASVAYKHPNAKDEFGILNVPCTGVLSVTFSIAEAIEKIFHIANDKIVKPCISWVHRDAIIRDETLSPAAAQYIERYLTLVKFTPSFHKVAPLLALWQNLRDKPDELELLLDALSRDFLLKYVHIHQFCRVPGCLVAVLSKLLHCIIGGPVQLFQALALPANLNEYLEVHRSNRHLLFFNIENCTGKYLLDLGKAPEYAVAEAIFLLDQWESVTAQKQGLADRSEYGNWSNVRNCMYHNFEIQSVKDWRIPCFDEVCFDFVSWRRPPLAAIPVTDVKWDKILRMLFSSRCTRDSKLKSLRSISDQLFLKCAQLRDLVSVFPTAEARVDVLVIFFTRLKDVQNMKMLRSRLAYHREEWEMLSERVGKIAIFPFFQPEQFDFSFNLGRHEDRLCASLILSLAFKERLLNILNPSLRLSDGTSFPFPLGVPHSWEKMENVPQNGELRFTYMCSADDRKMQMRRDMSKKYGGHCLDDNVIKEVVWWATLCECPAPVLTFLYYCMKDFPDACAVFREIDGPGGNGMITLHEMKDAVQKFGWKKFKKNPDLVKQVFRYLDPDGGGSISLEEWDVMQELFKELQLSMLEFLQFISRTFGDFDSAWQKMDSDGSDSIEHEEWDEAVKAIGFFGPSETIFQYLTIDSRDAPKSRRVSAADATIITRQGWKRLEAVYESKDELLDKIMHAS